jgi:hypothetical protein
MNVWEAEHLQQIYTAERLVQSHLRSSRRDWAYHGGN